MKPMFWVFVAIIYLGSFNAFAGPEEHRDAQVCYVISSADYAKIPDEVPTEICLESIKVDLYKKTIEAYSFFSNFTALIQNLKLTSLTNNHEGLIQFQASNVVENNYMNICGSQNDLQLFIGGQVNNNGEGLINQLSVAVQLTAIATSCHRNESPVVYNYKLR